MCKTLHVKWLQSWKRPLWTNSSKWSKTRFVSTKTLKKVNGVSEPESQPGEEKTSPNGVNNDTTTPANGLEMSMTDYQTDQTSTTDYQKDETSSTVPETSLIEHGNKVAICMTNGESEETELFVALRISTLGWEPETTPEACSLKKTLKNPNEVHQDHQETQPPETTIETDVTTDETVMTVTTEMKDDGAQMTTSPSGWEIDDKTRPTTPTQPTRPTDDETEEVTRNKETSSSKKTSKNLLLSQHGDEITLPTGVKIWSTTPETGVETSTANYQADQTSTTDYQADQTFTTNSQQDKTSTTVGTIWPAPSEDPLDISHPPTPRTPPVAGTTDWDDQPSSKKTSKRANGPQKTETAPETITEESHDQMRDVVTRRKDHGALTSTSQTGWDERRNQREIPLATEVTDDETTDDPMVQILQTAPMAPTAPRTPTRRDTESSGKPDDRWE
jgi:hypothetical protein